MTKIIWFPLYVGDYLKDTTHLNVVEHGIYFKLMLWYYNQGKPIPHTKRYAVAGATALPTDMLGSTNGDAMVDDILAEFFERDGDVWRHKRIDQEIKKRLDYHEKQSARAKKRWGSDDSSDDAAAQPRQSRGNAKKQSQSQDIGEVSPITPQEENGSKKYVTKPEDVSDQTWMDFVSHRKKKRADITHTAMNRIRSQAEKAGWSMDEALAESVARGWTGFNAEWVNKEGNGYGKVNRGCSKTQTIAEQIAAIGNE